MMISHQKRNELEVNTRPPIGRQVRILTGSYTHLTGTVIGTTQRRVGRGGWNAAIPRSSLNVRVQIDRQEKILDLPWQSALGPILEN